MNLVSPRPELFIQVELKAALDKREGYKACQGITVFVEDNEIYMFTSKLLA